MNENRIVIDDIDESSFRGRARRTRLIRYLELQRRDEISSFKNFWMIADLREHACELACMCLLAM